MKTKSLVKAGYIWYVTSCEPNVIKDNQTKNENIFYFQNDNEDIFKAAQEYRKLTINREKLIEDRNLYKFELLLGCLKKKCVKWKRENMK